MDLQPHDFDGSDYVPEHDFDRLSTQINRIFAYAAGRWVTKREIALATGAPEGSVGAQLQNLRKAPMGAHEVLKRPRGDRDNGLWEYWVNPVPGSGTPRRHPAVLRAEQAEQMAWRLAEQLSDIDPDNEVLFEYLLLYSS